MVGPAHRHRARLRFEGKQFGPVLAQPGALLAPVRAKPLDKLPEAPRVVEDTEVAELVHDHVVEHLVGRQHEPPVEGERAARRAGAPERALAADPDAPIGDVEPLGLLLGEGRNELPSADSRLRLADREPVQSQPRHLAPPLLLDPGPLIAKHALHLDLAHRAWRGQPRRLTPRHLQPPSPRPWRAPHLDLIHARDRSGRLGGL
jgi:hypothetical protein